MARQAKNGESTKKFGGSTLNEGTYFIHTSLVTEEDLNIDGNSEGKYDCLWVEVAHIQADGTKGDVLEEAIKMNGCWRERRGSDDKPYKASGSFYDLLFKECGHHSFDFTVEYIKQHLAGKKISVAYIRYPSVRGGFGYVPKIDLLP